MYDRRFACERARHRTFAVGGLRLHALEWGEAGQPGLCLLHGGAAHAHWFDGVAGAFADRFHVVALDQRGHGESQWAVPPAYATEDFAADLAGIADQLGWDRFVVMGHSMGGHNAMSFAAWHPRRVRGLVIVDSRPALPPERLERMHERGRRPARRHATLEAAVTSFRLLPRDTMADPALLAHLGRVGSVERDGGWVRRFDPAANERRKPVDAWLLVEQITAPTLVLRGELSPLFTPEMAERLRDAIPGARLAVIPRAYHHITLDAPDAVVEALDTFLPSLPA